MNEYVDVSSLQDISIVDFLARLGYHPVKKSGKEYFYHSMLRETKKRTPSFTVWDTGGKWVDRGGAGQANISGGGIIQFGMAYWPDLSFVEVLNKILEVNNLDIDKYIAPKIYPSQKDEEAYKYEVVRVRPAGSNFILGRYLDSRGIGEAAKEKLNDIYYRHRNDTDDERIFYAVGWQNEYNSWEFVTANGFKSSIGAKGLSIIPGQSDHVVLFEGYMDYLSWLTIEQPANMPMAIVLNSITMLGRAIERISNIPKIDVYFDNDEPGRICTAELRRLLPFAVDNSHKYQGYKDYNERLRPGPKQHVDIHLEQTEILPEDLTFPKR